MRRLPAKPVISEKPSGRVDIALSAYRAGQLSLQKAAEKYKLNTPEIRQLLAEAGRGPN